MRDGLVADLLRGESPAEDFFEFADEMGSDSLTLDGDGECLAHKLVTIRNGSGRGHGNNAGDSNEPYGRLYPWEYERTTLKGVPYYVLVDVSTP